MELVLVELVIGGVGVGVSRVGGVRVGELMRVRVGVGRVGGVNGVGW